MKGSILVVCPLSAAQTSSVFSLCVSLPRSVNVEIYIDDLGQNILFIFFETLYHQGIGIGGFLQYDDIVFCIERKC